MVGNTLLISLLLIMEKAALQIMFGVEDGPEKLRYALFLSIERHVYTIFSRMNKAIDFNMDY